ncbi:MAG: DUF2202 domain-containing protein [Anaerolineales bacterium]|nr:DUF2202 domain-containing protein [Anaerolineales bacterium]
MMRNILIGTFASILVVAIGTAAYNVIGVQAADVSEPTTVNLTQSQPETVTQDHAAELAAIPPADLSAEESAALLYMYEEEKLARDVYNTLFMVWNIPTFQNIAASEQMHMDSVQSLLDRYALTPPLLGAGSFADPTLQGLYSTLVAQGSQSIAEALKVGAAIEEIDILDLQTRLAFTNNADIQLVFNNLVNGSNNHLQAFVSALQNQTGEIYQSQYLNAEQYAAALAATQGNGYAGSNGNRQSGVNGNGQNGIPQVQAQDNLSDLSAMHGTVSAYAYGTLTIVTDDGQTVGIQLGNSNYVTSLGFAPQAGQGVTVIGFPGDQGLFSATSVAVDGGATYTFRESTGRPAWAGGKGNGGGGNP